MRLWKSVASAALVVAGCTRSQPISFAQVEAGGPSAQPPLIHAARVEDPSLRRLQRGQLIIHAVVGYQPTRAVVTIALSVASSGSLTDTTSTRGVLESEPLPPGEYLVSARHVGVVPQLVRIHVTAGFADTVLFTLGQR